MTGAPIAAGAGPGTPTAAALEQARAHFIAGNQHFEADRLDDARVSFEAALALAPARPSVLANLGVTLFRLGHWPEAIVRLEAATAADAAQADAWQALGLSHKQLAHWPQAAAALRQAVQQKSVTASAWLALGQCEERIGDLPAALRAFELALELDEGLAEAWSARGGLLQLAFRHAEAATCFERAIALGADAELHRFYLASMRGDATPARPPRAYVESLFDQYAGEFEQHLLKILEYRGHETLLQPLLAQAARYPMVLDLGCGTGLCARTLQHSADAIDGVDLSLSMVEQARATGLYRRVLHDDLLPFLAASDEPVDLVVAADVFIYVGDLQGVFAAVRRRLRASGWFAFSVEIHAGPQDFQLQPSLRYAHARDYLERLAAEQGLRIERQWEAPLRLDRQEPIKGLYLHLRDDRAA